MKSVSCRIILVITLLAACLVWSTDAARAAEITVVAVLDVERVMRDSKAGKALQDQIDSTRSANQKKDREAEDALRAADRQLRDQRALLSAEAYAKKRDELQTRLTTLQRDFDARRKRLQQAMGQAWNQISEALAEVTADLATEQKIDIVVSKASTVLLANELDITAEVLTRLDAKLSKVTLSIGDQ